MVSLIQKQSLDKSRSVNVNENLFLYITGVTLL